jgi:hypothetical protein
MAIDGWVKTLSKWTPLIGGLWSWVKRKGSRIQGLLGGTGMA